MIVSHWRDGILIRPLTATDAGALFAAVSSSLPTLSQWLPWATPAYARADAEAWIAYCGRARDADEEYHFGVFDAASDGLIGGVGLNHRVRATGAANLGYWVSDAVRGRGVAVAAAKQAAHFGFETLGLRRIVILVQADNHASLRVAEKLGAVREELTHDGIVLHGRTHPAWIHSLPPEQTAQPPGPCVPGNVPCAG